MKTIATRVTRLLNGRSTEDTDADADTSGDTAAGDGYDTSSEPTTMSRDDLKTAVKEGVTEALDEYQMSFEEEGDTSDASSDGGSSQLKSSLALLTTLGTVAAFGYARRRRGQSDDEERQAAEESPTGNEAT